MISELIALLPILFFSTLRLSTPLLLAALGGLYSERSGVINIALEGMMLAGAFTGAAVTYKTGSPWVGLLAGIVAGVVIAWIYALFTIKYKADQVVSGTAINILMVGLPGFLSGAFFLSTGSTPQIPKEQLIPYSPIVIAFVMVPVTWYVLFKTPFGLRLRAVGENPSAADAAGVSVGRIRYAGVLISGALAAIGGAYLSIGQSSLFTRNMTAGRGFIALAALIFGKWRPVQTMLACLLFGFTEALTIQIQGVPVPRVSILSIGLVIITGVILFFTIRFGGKKYVWRENMPLWASIIIGVVSVVVARILVQIGIYIYLERKGAQASSYWLELAEVPVQFIHLVPYVLTIIVLAGFIGASRAPKALGQLYQKER
jgi:simple sugar transport system permease protein